MSNESKQLYCIESIDGEMFSNQEIVDMLNSQHKLYSAWEFEKQNCQLCSTELKQLRKENEQLRQDLKSLETTSNATSDYNAHLEGKIITLENENEQLRKEKESWKNIACQDLSKWSIFSNEVTVLHETKDIERFLEKYYEYCADMVRK